MWTPGRITRTSSARSVAVSVHSSPSSGNSSYSSTESVEEQDHNPFDLEDDPQMWAPKKSRLALNSAEHFLVAAQQHHKLHLQEQRRRESVSTDNSHSTLAEEVEVEVPLAGEEMDLKTPTVRAGMVVESMDPDDEPEKKDWEPAGPMQHLLQSLLRKVTDVERGRPTVMAEDYEKLQKRASALESDYTALLAIRNEDLVNLIKVRDVLADERREHAAIRKLRDEDLHNVLVLREKLAEATWSRPQQGRPSVMTSLTPITRMSRSDGDDLWQQARTAAMEQRILELEKANKVLRAESLTGGSGTGDVLSRMEMMFEDALKQREKIATRLQQLRSEKEVLQKEVALLEDRNGELEALVERLQRTVRV